MSWGRAVSTVPALWTRWPKESRPELKAVSREAEAPELVITKVLVVFPLLFIVLETVSEGFGVLNWP